MDGFGTLNDWLALALLVCFLALLAVVVFQQIRIVYHRHRKQSFQFVFLLLCLPWIVLRVVLLALSLALGELPTGAYIPLAWLPVNLEVASYTLLIVFFAQIIYRTSWEQRHRKQAIAGWAFGNAVFLITTVVWISLAVSRIVTPANKVFIFLRYLVTGLAFGILAALLIYFGVKLQRVLRQPAALLPFKANGRSVGTVALVTVVLVLVFAARAVYCWVIAYIAIAMERFPGDTALFRFLATILSEVLPISVILAFFWHVPSTPSRNRAYKGPGFRSPAANGAAAGETDTLKVTYASANGGYGAINDGGRGDTSDDEAGGSDDGDAAATPGAGDDDDDDDAQEEVISFPPTGAAARTAVVSPAMVMTSSPPPAPAPAAVVVDAAATAAAVAPRANATLVPPFGPPPPARAPPFGRPVEFTASQLDLPSAASAVDYRAGAAFLAAADRSPRGFGTGPGSTSSHGWTRANGAASASSEPVGAL